MSSNIKFDCKESFIRETIFFGNGGKIYCNFFWRHVTLTLNKVPIFTNYKAMIPDILTIDFNGTIGSSGGTDWDNFDEKMHRKIQRIFNSADELDKPGSLDGRDFCISKAVIKKLSKIGFEIESDIFYIDKKLNKYSEVTEI